MQAVRLFTVIKHICSSNKTMDNTELMCIDRDQHSTIMAVINCTSRSVTVHEWSEGQ